MKRFTAVLVPMLAMALVGCTDGESTDGALDEQDGADEVAAAGWTEIAPSVWERARLQGGFERIGFGADGLAFALETAPRESAQEKPERAGDEHIEYLEASLREAREVESQLRAKDPDAEPPPLYGAVLAASSGSVCGGYYGVDISFLPGIAYSEVTTTVDWSDFGPFLPYTLKLRAFAWAAMGDGSGDSVGNWSTTESPGATIAATTQSSAMIGPTFTAKLMGRGYVKTTNGCNTHIYYEARND